MCMELIGYQADQRRNAVELKVGKLIAQRLILQERAAETRGGVDACAFAFSCEIWPNLMESCFIMLRVAENDYRCRWPMNMNTLQSSRTGCCQHSRAIGLLSIHYDAQFNNRNGKAAREVGKLERSAAGCWQVQHDLQSITQVASA